MQAGCLGSVEVAILLNRLRMHFAAFVLSPNSVPINMVDQGTYTHPQAYHEDVLLDAMHGCCNYNWSMARTMVPLVVVVAEMAAMWARHMTMTHGTILVALVVGN